MSDPNFRYAPMHWRTVADLRAHLKRHSPSVCDWVQGIVIHHTVSPIPATWKGLESINNIKNFYKTQGWTSGPQLFICHGAPNPAHNGIFQMTPLNLTGTHARQCNSTTWGIEVVGNYTAQPWSDETMALVMGAVHELTSWRRLPINRQTIRFHKECVPDTECPGRAIRDRFDWLVEGMKWRATNA